MVAGWSHTYSTVVTAVIKIVVSGAIYTHSSVIATPGSWSKASCSWSYGVCIMTLGSPITTSLYTKAEYMATSSTTAGKDSSLSLLTRKGIITSVTIGWRPWHGPMLSPSAWAVATISGDDRFWPSISNLFSSRCTGDRSSCCDFSSDSDRGDGIGTGHTLSWVDRQDIIQDEVYQTHQMSL